MDTIFMNSENSKTSDTHRLLLNLSDKINLKSDKYIALSILSIYYMWKNIKRTYKNNKFKISLRHGIKSFNYVMDHNLYENMSISSKNMRQLLIVLQ